MASENKAVPATNAETTSTNVVALPKRPEATTPSEKAIGFVKEHPVLTVVGGVAVGLAISALIPRSFSRRFAKKAYRYAEAGAAAALSFGQDAVDEAEDGSAVARKKAALLASRAEKLSEKAAERAEKLSEKAIARAEKLGVAALGTATVLGHAAAERAERLGHVAAVRAEDLGGRASDRLSQLGDKALVQSSKLFGVPAASTSVADRILDKAHGVRARIRG
ncbi:hypothetical protein [Novosphingobium sp. 9U]|uniref:hypothetical protein n=1 Tax=Novosphingobium sp. 9U TaxID=2653158 RepID=UPI0012EEF2C9|nr:hypothetical protein [Novosphingobium sp. 9U]VWX52090.1 conserved hypothetical protein [Novosphingobium sp. 9U]